MKAPIELPIYGYSEYDWDGMAEELESRILNTLGKSVSITIRESK